METSQKGRSMVEMLGVLAIIGVLSAGALAGYSKAMFRHRVNQTIDIFQSALQRFSELEQKRGFNIEDHDAIVQYGFLPNCKESENGCELPLGNFDMSVTDDSWGQHGGMWMRFTSAKACVAFSSVHWENTIPVDWWNPSGFLEIGNQAVYAPNRPDNPDNEVTMSEIVENCQKCDEDDFCDFYLVIRREF